MTYFDASVQYNDLKGSVAVDRSDSVSMIDFLQTEQIAKKDERIVAIRVGIGENHGAEVSDVALVAYLTDEEGFVKIEDCIKISRNIEHNLDREEEDFSLEVSSAGMTKPFRVLKQYLKNVGREVKVQTLDHGKSFEGILKSANEEGFVIETKEGTFTSDTANHSWPDEIPKSVPEFLDGKIVNISTRELGASKNWNLLFEEVGDKALSDYKTKLKENGFKVSSITMGGTNTQITGENNDLIVVVMGGDGMASLSVGIED